MPASLDKPISSLAEGMIQRIAMIVAGVVLAAIIVVAGDVLLDRNLLTKYDPDLSAFGWMRKAVTASVALLFFLALRPSDASRRAVFGEPHVATIVAVTTFCMAIMLILSAIAVATIPHEIGNLVREGKPLSIKTEVVFVIALGFLLHTAWVGRHLVEPRFFGISPRLAIWGMFGVAFLIVMEEMSWGQHWIGWEAGEVFAANEQNETNLHNFATHRFEAVYYTTAFFLFVMLPWAWPRAPHPRLAPLAVFVPPPGLALAGVALSGLWYNDWNIVPYQIWFFLGLLVAADLMRTMTGTWRLSGLIMIALIVGTQALFLMLGGGMEDGHEFSEVREFLIALLVAVYALLLNGRIRRWVAAPVPR